MNPRRRDEHAFTLLEVIIVCVIIAILFAIIVPSFLGEKRAGTNKSTIAAAQTFEQAAAEYQRSYPPTDTVGDTLLRRGGYTGDFTPTLPPTQGLYSAAGDPIVKNWPQNAFVKRPVAVKRGACTLAPSLGDVLLCRGTNPDGTINYESARVIAWGKSSAGSTVVVYDSQACAAKQGLCPVS